MTWFAVGPAEAVAEGHAAVFDVSGCRIAVCHSADGFYAIDDVCSHDGGPLDQGRLEGNRIECPRHSAVFDIRSGRPLTLPAVRPVRSYPVRLTGDTIEVEVT